MHFGQMVMLLMLLMVMMVRRRRRERLGTVTMHRGVRHVTAGTASFRCDGNLRRVPVIPSLGNRDLSRPELNVLLLLLTVVVHVMLLLVVRLVGRLRNLLFLSHVAAPETLGVKEK